MVLRIWNWAKPSALDEPIDRLLEEMKMFGPDSPEYPSLVKHLSTLVRLKAEESAKRRISPDTMVLVIGNLVGILIIIAYEQKHVMVSKAFGFVSTKGKLGA